MNYGYEFDYFDRPTNHVREDAFVLFKGNYNERVERKIRKRQMTTERLAMMFNLSNFILS